MDKELPNITLVQLFQHGDDDDDKTRFFDYRSGEIHEKASGKSN